MSNFHPLQVVCRGSETQLQVGKKLNYCRSGNIREVLFFANFASMSNSRIQESCENYYFNTLLKKNEN